MSVQTAPQRPASDDSKSSASNPGTEVPVRITASFTADPLRTVLEFWWEKLQLGSQVQVSDYNQVFQELLNPASGSASHSGVNVLLLRLEDFRREAEGVESDRGVGGVDPMELADELYSAIEAFSSRVQTPLVVGLCPQPSSPPPERRAVEGLRERLAELPNVSLLADPDFARYRPRSQLDPERDRLAHIPYTDEYFAAMGSAIARRAHAHARNPAKVLALDCDNTLWGGVVGEDGPSAVDVSGGHASLQNFAVDLQEKGVVLALVSKNADEDVAEVFEHRSDMPLRPHHLVARRVNWEPKPKNLDELAQELNLGTDSFVFLDDNPVECGQVRELLPEVCCLQIPSKEQLPQFLDHLWPLDVLRVTQEDKARTQLYRQAAERSRFESSVQDMTAFIQGLRLEVDISPPSPAQLPRVSQLTQRTNQFNLTTIRRSESDFRNLGESGKQVLQCSVKDRFGDYGLVGVMIHQLDDEALSVDSFLLSCRVLGRGVEHAMLAKLGEVALDHGLPRVDIPFIPTQKNQPAQNFVESLGAKYGSATEDGVCYRLPSAVAAEASFTSEYSEKQLEVARRKQTKKASPEPATSESKSQLYQSIASNLNDAESVLKAVRKKNQRARPPEMGPARPAQTEIQRELASMWCELLGLQEVGVRDDFFDLGGTSLAAASFFAQVERRFGCRLPLTTVLNQGTIEDIAHAVDRSAGPTNQPPTTDLVELRPGRWDVAPCFFIHDGEGETLLYRNLAQRLPDGVPAYGIEPRRAQSAPTIHTTIEAMAQDYVHRIRKAVPHGPYVLFGLCAGGVLAHEVGRRLREAGGPVAFVGIADAATPDAPKTHYQTAQRASGAAEALKEADPRSPLRSGARASTTLVRKASNLLRHGVESKLTNVREWTQIAWTEYTQDRQGRFLAPLSFSQIFDRAMDRHQVTPWPCPGVLFKSTEEDSSVPDDVPYSRLYKDPELGWRPYCTEGLEVLDCPGGHTTLLRQPHVQAVAERLARVWDGGLRLISKEARDPKVLAVIVNYKTAELSLNNARSVAQARQTLPNLELVVVENDSGDEEALQAGLADPMFEGWAHLHVEPANGGFSKGNNSAIRPALESDHPPDYVLLLNPDAELRPSAAQTLVDFMEQNPSAGIAGPLLENGDGTDWNIAFRFPNLASEFDAGLKLGVVSRLLEPFLVARVMGDARSTIDWIPGAAMIIRRQVFHDAGLMDDNYFLYFEETDFCRAAKKAGWECWYVPDARVVHIAGQSTGVTVRDAKPKRLPSYWFESRRRYFVKNHGETYAAACDAAHLTGLGLHKLRSLIQRRDDELPPKYMEDLWSHSVLMPRNRKR